MIAIVNRGRKDGKNRSPKGEHIYTVQINNKVVTMFTHLRQDKLSVCLQRALDAVRAAEECPDWEGVQKNETNY